MKGRKTETESEKEREREAEKLHGTGRKRETNGESENTSSTFMSDSLTSPFVYRNKDSTYFQIFNFVRDVKASKTYEVKKKMQR